MVLVIKKTTKLTGEFKVEDVIVKTTTVDIDENGVSTVFEYMNNADLYAANRREMRKQEKEFRDKRYEVEDAILAEIEKKNTEQQA